jgi:hypothetical protein
MANPNILNVTSIFGDTAYVIPSTTAANSAWKYDGTTALTGLTPAANSVHKIDSIVVSNTTGSAAPASVAVYSAAALGGVANYLAYAISVPANASLIVTDKTTSFYVTENQSVGVTSGTGSALTFVASFEIIT